MTLKNVFLHQIVMKVEETDHYQQEKKNKTVLYYYMVRRVLKQIQNLQQQLLNYILVDYKKMIMK